MVDFPTKIRFWLPYLDMGKGRLIPFDGMGDSVFSVPLPHARIPANLIGDFHSPLIDIVNI
jgi:hypothetical protein